MSNNIKMDDVFDLGTWLGRKQAFAAVSGRCSAADAECLRTIRKKKLYQARGVTWEQFCSQYAGISRSLADDVIRRLEEFGPAYFHLTGVAKMTAQAFRLIAPAVSEEGVQFGEEKIAFTPENAARIAAAVDELRTRAEARPKEQPATAEDQARSLTRARKTLAVTLAELERVSTFEMDLVERQALRAALDAAMRKLGELTLVVPR
jgi:hypothetical protein